MPIEGNLQYQTPVWTGIGVRPGGGLYNPRTDQTVPRIFRQDPRVYSDLTSYGTLLVRVGRGDPKNKNCVYLHNTFYVEARCSFLHLNGAPIQCACERGKRLFNTCIQGVIYFFSFVKQLFPEQRLRKSWSGNWLAVFLFGRKMIWTAHWFQHQDYKGMLSCGMKCCLFVQQTGTRMHTVIDAFNCRFGFIGRLSIMFVKVWHLCEMLYVWPRQTDTKPPL